MKADRISVYIYVLIMSACFFSVVWLLASGDVPSKGERSFESSVELVSGWTDMNGNALENISRLDKLGVKKGSVSCILPEIKEGNSLNFRAKHLYYNVLLDGETIYSQILPNDDRLYTNSDGIAWAWVPLKKEYSGRKLTIEYELCYKSSPSGINDIYIGRTEGYVLTLFTKKTGIIVLSVIYMLIALLLIVADLPVNFRNNKSHELLYLGFVSFSIGAYVFVETQSLQIFIGNDRIVHLMSFLTLMLIPIPVVLYASEAFGFRYRYTSLIFSCCTAAAYSALFIMNYYDIADYHDAITVIHIALVCAALLTMYAIIRYYLTNRGPAFSVMRLIGVAALAVTGTIDVIRYYSPDLTDAAKYVRVGILVFIICFGISSVNKIVDAVKSGAKAEVIRTLAYSDGLTGLGNRTAYNEKLDEIRASGASAGIIMLDVNNLKKVNDGLGHELGDKLLCLASEYIKKSFGADGAYCYRTGGDEFVVIIEKGDFPRLYVEGAEKLLRLCAEFNSVKGREFDISIANGFCSSSEERSVDDACREADAIMYENKRIMKSAMAKG